MFPFHSVDRFSNTRTFHSNSAILGTDDETKQLSPHFHPLQVNRSRSSGRLDPIQTRDAGDSFRSARNLGTFEDGDLEIRTGRTDEDDPDYFKFNVDIDGRGRIQVRISNTSLNRTELDVFLYDKNFKRIASETGIDALDVERLTYKQARRGTYYLKVIGDDDRTTRYSLTFFVRD